MNIEGKILIIDDEIDICEQLSGLLNDRGFTVIIVFLLKKE